MTPNLGNGTNFEECLTVRFVPPPGRRQPGAVDAGARLINCPDDNSNGLFRCFDVVINERLHIAARLRTQ